MQLELYLSQIIKKERSNMALSPFLWIFSKLFGFLVFCKNSAYKMGLCKPKKIAALVISIGNVSCGGTGKTPLVKLLAQTLKTEVAILSRGYRSKFESQNVKIASGNGPLFEAEDCGDEPFLLAKGTKSHIWVGKDRILSAKKAVNDGLRILILDDGLQHRKIYQDFKIITVDANDPLGRGAFLPKGWLRDSLNRLSEADLIVVNNVDDEKHFLSAVEKLKKYTGSPIAGAKFILKDLEAWRGKKVSAFCGIAKPENFFKALEDGGVEIVGKRVTCDHKLLSLNDLDECLESGAEAILCTEKDYVKLKDNKLPIYPILGNLAIKYGSEHFNNLIHLITLRIYGD